MIKDKCIQFFGAVDFSRRSVEVIDLALSKSPKSLNGVLINGYYYKHIGSYRKNALEVLNRHELKIIIDPGTYVIWRKNPQIPFKNFLPQLIENITWTYTDLVNQNFSRNIFGIFLPDHHMDPDDTKQIAFNAYHSLVENFKIPETKLIGVCHGFLPEIPTRMFLQKHIEQHLEGIKECCYFYINHLGLNKIGLGACSAFKIKANPMNLFQKRAEVLSKLTETLGSNIHIHALGVGTKDLLNKIREFIHSFDTQTYLTNTKVRRLRGQARTEAAVRYLLDLLSG
ncbi:MAG: hypothetical protein QXF61_10490 [Nitrososphaeria archaeon]